MTRSTVRFAVVASLAIILAACGDDSPAGPGNGDPTNAAPTVMSTGPQSDAISVPRNAAVTVTFSEAMTPSSINATTFTLVQGSTPILSTVTYAGVTATLVPTGTLPANTILTARVSTGALDAAGKAMAAAMSWSFRTVATSADGPAAVNLGTAGDYVILAKSAISTTGTTAVTGDLGLSPAAATFITGFDMLTPPTTYTTSALVTGQIFASDFDTPTPANLTTAVLDMEAAYTDAAGRTLPDFTELGAGNIDGLTLTAGLYKWGTGVAIPIGVTLNGGANDVFIFQIAQDLTVGNGAIITLTGGVQAQNIFWQVAGAVTLGTTADFKGIILSQTLISMNTGATVLGRALAQTAVTLDATAITQP